MLLSCFGPSCTEYFISLHQLVVATSTAKNFDWLCFKICWIWKEVILIFYPPYEEGQTHTAVKGLN
jgi:hypothetical protein